MPLTELWQDDGIAAKVSPEPVVAVEIARETDSWTPDDLERDLGAVLMSMYCYEEMRDASADVGGDVDANGWLVRPSMDYRSAPMEP